jgi:hypothetical protein
VHLLLQAVDQQVVHNAVGKSSGVNFAQLGSMHDKSEGAGGASVETG